LILTTVNGFALRAEYRFEKCDGSATTRSSATISSLIGKLTGDANITINGGQIKNGLRVFGNGAMSIEHNKALDLVQDLTIAFWVNPEDKKRQALIVKGGGSGRAGSDAEYSLVLWENGKFKYKHNGTADIFSKSTIPLDSWTHIVVVRDNNLKTIKIYINGKLDASLSYTIDPSSSNTEKLLIGTGEFYSATMGNFAGTLDEIKIYSIALSENEIKKMYNSENGKKYYTTVECATPHKAPEAVNDMADLPIEGVITIDVLSNDIIYDTDKCKFDRSSVQIVSDIKNSIISDNNKTLTVTGEGIWKVLINGSIEFISNSNFYDNPTDIFYSVSDSCGGVSNKASISLTRVATIIPTVEPTPTPVPTATLTSTPTPSPSIKKNVTIGDRVWYDSNKNGLQDSGEIGVNGVIVVLYNSKGEVLEKKTTNGSGKYLFKDIKKGTYTISFNNLPKGYIFTMPNVGNDENIDSDADSGGRVSNIVIKRDNLTYDAGIISAVSEPIINNGGVIGNSNCNCDDYKSSLPSINLVGIFILSILMSVAGTLSIQKKKFNFNRQGE